jgi:uncharacterized protein YbjT (DUF2867 family)
MILVTGATGFVGRHLIQRLLQDNQQVRVLIPEHQLNNIREYQSDENPFEIVVGTLMDDEALYQAVSGVHLIIHLDSAMWWGRQREIERFELVGTRNLIAAARAARVGRMMVLSHLGASPSSAFVLLRMKGQFEALVRDSGLAYTILRVGILFGEDDVFINHIASTMSLNPVYHLMPGIGEIVLHPLYIDDLIEAMVRCLGQLNTVDQIIEIGGIEYITYSDLLSTIMRLTGKSPYVVSVPPYFMRFLVRLQGLVFRRTLMTQQTLDYIAASRTAPLNNLYHTFGITAHRLEDTLLRYLPQKRLWGQAIRHAFKRRPKSI